MNTPTRFIPGRQQWSMDHGKVKRAFALLQLYWTTQYRKPHRKAKRMKIKYNKARVAMADEWFANKLCEWEKEGRLTEDGTLRVAGQARRTSWQDLVCLFNISPYEAKEILGEVA